MPTSAEKEAFEPLVYCIKSMTRFRGWQPDEERGIRAIFPLLEKAIKSPGPDEIVEVGSWVGQNAIDMADSLSDGSGDEYCPLIHCVDTWRGSEGDTTSVVADVLNRDDPNGVFNVFRKNVGDRWGVSIIPHRTDSLTAAKMVADESVAAVFIDASHDYEAVLADIKAWWPKVRVGGLLCGHDYNSFSGVKQAVIEEFNREFGVVGNCWYVWKTSNNNGPISSANS